MPVKIGGLKAGQTNEYALKCFFTPGKDASFIFDVSFSDILGNTYKQSHTMIVSKNELFFSAASTPSKQVLGSGEKGHSGSGEKGHSGSGEKGHSESGEKGHSESGEKGHSESGEKGHSESGEKGQFLVR